MVTLAVLDTHALMWAAAGKHRLLGRRARSFLERVDGGRAAAYVPTIALVELGEAARRGDITFPGGFDAWVEESQVGDVVASRNREPLAVALRAQELFDIPERTDRLVAATASVLDCPLVTRDPDIARAPAIEVLW